MNQEEKRTNILAALAKIAPEVDVSRLPPEADVREALDFDSMDVLHFATALGECFGVEVPEADYARIVSVAGCLRYLDEHGR